jgi:hypothetical protein
MSRSVDLDASQDRERLSNLALTAERARYAASGVPGAALETAWEQGRELLASIDKLQAPEAGARAAP